MQRLLRVYLTKSIVLDRKSFLFLFRIQNPSAFRLFSAHYRFSLLFASPAYIKLAPSGVEAIRAGLSWNFLNHINTAAIPQIVLPITMLGCLLLCLR